MTELSPGSVTTADLYRVLQDMHKDVTKALERLAQIDQRNTNADGIHTDHEARLRMLERWKYTMIGASGVVGAIAGWIAQYLASRGGHP